jgi:hypothetical protein
MAVAYFASLQSANPAATSVGEVYMPETKTQLYSGNLENALFELVRQAVRAEQEISRRNDDRLLTIDQVAQRLSVSKD